MDPLWTECKQHHRTDAKQNDGVVVLACWAAAEDMGTCCYDFLAAQAGTNQRHRELRGTVNKNGGTDIEAVIVLSLDAEFITIVAHTAKYASLSWLHGSIRLRWSSKATLQSPDTFRELHFPLNV